MDLQSAIPADLKTLRAAFQRRGFDVRLVGGCVRDWHLQIGWKDIDLCTDANPDEQIAIYKEDGFRYHETGLQHGTVTAVLKSGAYEVTSLRTETDHDGRHAAVSYTRDWIADLGRRDLTINAMAMTFDGELVDPFNGLEDLKNRIVRFVGNPDDRMKEDYLRILRWLRFHGRIAPKAPLDQETVEAAQRQAGGLRGISRERVWMEVSKIISGNSAPALIDSMYDLGIAAQIDLPLGAIGRLGYAHQRTRNPVSLLFALLSIDSELEPVPFPNMAERWKWSAEERDLAAFLDVHDREDRSQFILKFDNYVRWLKRLVAHDGHPMPWVIELALIRGETAAVDVLTKWEVPTFPVKGQDLLAAGMKPGPQMGAVLKALKEKWTDSDYALTKDELLTDVA